MQNNNLIQMQTFYSTPCNIFDPTIKLCIIFFFYKIKYNQTRNIQKECGENKIHSLKIN